MDQRDTCPVPDLDDPNTSFFVKAGHYLNVASQVEFDPDAIVEEAVECYDGYHKEPDTLPSAYVNLKGEGQNARFCLGMSDKIGYRFPALEVQGINRFIATGCTPETANTCTCTWYRQPVDYLEGEAFNHVGLWVVSQLVNTFISLQWMFYYCLFSLFPFVDHAWHGVMLRLGQGRLPTWFLRIWGNFGLDGVSSKRRWFCFVVHGGSFVTFVLFVYLLVLFYYFNLRDPLSLVVQLIFLASGIFRLARFCLVGYKHRGGNSGYPGLPVVFSHFNILILLLVETTPIIRFWLATVLFGFQSLLMIGSFYFPKPKTLPLIILLLVVFTSLLIKGLNYG